MDEPSLEVATTNVLPFEQVVIEGVADHLKGWSGHHFSYFSLYFLKAYVA
jgi:hypothetical protein